MVFDPTIPKSTDKLKVSQPQLLENNSKLDSIFDVDHVKFSDATGDAGKHESSTYVNRTAKALTIPPTTTTEEFAIYVKDDASNDPQIFYQQPNSAGAGVELQLTGLTNLAAAGESNLFSGMKIKWGTFNTSLNVAGVITIDYTTIGLTDFISDVFVVQVQTEGFRTNIIYVDSKSITGFVLGNTQGTPTMDVTWLAIGL